ncbi:hypothetical protein ACOBQJ_15170 [Pelotomaculum propionicicum]|uniref:hypothetical protein n=1 Tax=Pelotomaculum propionicicum TaxID=258475 RepID=UPI003B7DB3C5
MANLKEVLQLAEILGERLKDEKPDERLILRCVEAVWPYIYPYGLLSYMQSHAEDPPEKADRLKSDKILKAVTGSRRKWRSFIMGICYTYRERHSIKRARIRLVNKAIKKGALMSAAELEDLAESFRKQALECARMLEELKLDLFLDMGAAAEKSRLAKSMRNDGNIPRFLRLSRYIDCGSLLQTLPAEIMKELESRYEKPTSRTLVFDALQEYIALDDVLWKQFKDRLTEKFKSMS